MYPFSDLIELYRTMGALRFFIFFGMLTAVLVAYGTVGWLLSDKIGWPDDYGFYCKGRSCLWIELYHSNLLLRKGHLYELLLFLWMWIIPMGMIVPAAFIVLKRWVKNRRNRIRPLR